MPHTPIFCRAMPALTRTACPARNRALNQTGLDARNGIQQADMGGDVNHPQTGRHQHHGDFRRAGQLCQQFRMTGIQVSASMKRGFVQRRGADGVHFAALGKPGGNFDVLKCRVARLGGDLPPGQVLRNELQVDAIHGSHGVARAFGGRQTSHLESTVHNAPGLSSGGPRRRSPGAGIAGKGRYAPSSS